MQRFFRIKWELILSILLIITAISCCLLLFVEFDIYTITLSIISILAVISFLCFYSKIKEFRYETIKLWQ